MQIAACRIACIGLVGMCMLLRIRSQDFKLTLGADQVVSSVPGSVGYISYPVSIGYMITWFFRGLWVHVA